MYTDFERSAGANVELDPEEIQFTLGDLLDMRVSLENLYEKFGERIDADETLSHQYRESVNEINQMTLMLNIEEETLEDEKRELPASYRTLLLSLRLKVNDLRRKAEEK